MNGLASEMIENVQKGYVLLYNQLSPLIGESYLQLFTFTIGLSIYAIFVWYFYKSLSKRDLFKIDLEKYKLPYIKHKTLGKAESILAYILKYGIVFPVYVFIWFLILSLFLLILSEEITVSNILLTSIAVVSTVRVISYFKEDMSSDLAKLMPLALLAIALSNPNFFSAETALARLSEIPILWSQIVQFLIFSIVLEWILRILHLIKLSAKKKT